MKKLKKTWWIVVGVIAILAIAGVIAFLVLRDKPGDKEDYREEKTVDGAELQALTYKNLGMAEYEFYLNEETDTDGDGLPDIQERSTYETDPFSCDTDGDGLDDYSEINEYKTRPDRADTDGDGLPDGMEILAGLDPLQEKTDGQTTDDEVTFERTYEAEGLTMEIKGNASVCDVYVDTFTMGSGGNTKALISPIYEFYKKGSFEEATITIRYDEDRISEGSSEENLSICQFTDTEEWVKVDSVVDTENNTITATLEHFSKYGVLDISEFGEKKNVNVMLVIDDSGSMYPEEMCPGSIESDLEFKRLDMVNSFVEDLDDNARVGMAYFTGDYVKCCEMGSTDEQIAAATEEIKSRTEHNFNGTAILTALNEALNEFPAGSTDANFIIILTDGETSESGLAGLLANYSWNTVVNKSGLRNVRIITVGLGAGVKAEYLRDLAQSTNGTYVYANNANTLSMVYTKLQDMVNDTYIDVDDDGVVDEVLVADSGFDMATEAFSFENPIIKTDERLQTGLCAGMAVFTNLNHSGTLPAKAGYFGYTNYGIWAFRAFVEMTNLANAAENVAFTEVAGYDEEDLKALGFEIRDGKAYIENVRKTLCTDTTKAMTELRKLQDADIWEVDGDKLVIKDEVLETYKEYTMLTPHLFEKTYHFNGKKYTSYEYPVYDYTAEIDEKTAQIFALLARLYVEQYNPDSYDQLELKRDFESVIIQVQLGNALYMGIPDHAVNLVKITRDFENVNVYYLYVYDNNYPDELQKYTVNKTGSCTYKLTNPAGEEISAFFRNYARFSLNER